MDSSILKASIVNVLKSLPPEMRQDTAQVFSIIAKHIPKLMEIGPSLMPDLMPQIHTVAMEFAMGMLDTDGLDKTLSGAFAEVGLTLPKMSYSGSNMDDNPRSHTHGE